MMFFRSPYNYDRAAASLESGLACADESRTQQQFKADADINNIVKRFMHTGQVTAPVNVPEYGDWSQVVDFQTAMNLIRQSAESFAGLPAQLRERFGNDPGQLLEFLGDGRNRDEAVRLGLIDAPANAGVPPAATTPPAS